MQRVARLLRQIIEVTLVVLREDDVCDTSSLRPEHLLLHPADRKYPAGQSELSGHRHVGTNRSLTQSRDHRDRHRDSGRWTFLRDRARRYVNVDLVVLELFFRDTQRIGVHPGIRQTGPGALLHHVAELTREDETITTGHHAAFDDHYVAAERRVVHTCGHPDGVLEQLLLRVNLRLTDQVTQVLRRHGNGLGFP